ncbi:MAG: HAMP domain-containing sensor histidine kinase [Bacteroidota bacterium]
MNYKIPSSILVALYLATGLSLLHLLLVNGGATMGNSSLNSFLMFFLISFLVLVFSMEYFVFQRLRTLRLISEREIKKLRELETYRREFLGEVSHELKTPIFAIQGFIDTLLEGAMDDEKFRKKFLKKAAKNADRLSSLVQDLLLITQAESGEIEMRIRGFAFYELLNEVIDSIYYKFTKKKRNITCRVVPNGNEDTIVYADRERIHQVMINLIDNAIKYGDVNGEVTIELQAMDNDHLSISVHDDGPGIEDEHLEKIFRRFYRVDKSRSRDRGGTGLGLAICKHFLEAHNEKIHVKSIVGEGTTFQFSLQTKEKALT